MAENKAVVKPGINAEHAAIKKRNISFRAYEEIHANHPQTTYLESIMHLYKGNIGTGVYAMALAMKHAGIVVGPILLIIIGLICVHVQHVLINCADFVKAQNNLDSCPDFAATIELSFLSSKIQKWQRLAPKLKTTCNIFICVTQLGFCSVYVLFVGLSVQSVLAFYGYNVKIYFLAAAVVIPIWLTAIIRQLKYIAIFSGIANCCVMIGIVLILGYAGRNLPAISERNYFGSWETLPLYFGTALFAFEGIALALPLKNSMKKPETFASPLGVLNVGNIFVGATYIVVGVIGYWKYGELTAVSVTLNLPNHEILAQVTKLMIACGVMFGYAIQFFVAVQIIFSNISEKWKFATKHPVCAEIIFRTFLVLVTFIVAVAVPNLSLLLSLIGSVCCTVLAFVLPVLAELVILHGSESGIGAWIWIKNSTILLIAFLGVVFGGVVSMKEIVLEFMKIFS